MDFLWELDVGYFPIWQDIQQCLPPSAADWTDSLAASVVGDVGGTVTHNGNSLPADTARNRVLSLGNGVLDGDIEVTQPSRLSVDALTGPPDVAPAVRHSYTSLKTFDECPRKHYLDYVVNAFPDYTPDDEWSGTEDGPSQQTVGVLFHDTAEAAADEGKTTQDEWYAICERLANQRRAHDAIETAKTCIDRYFELDISDWKVIDAERHFEITVDGEDVVGYIDAVYRTPSDELVVVDYKATKRERDIDENRQLPLYLLACRDLYDDPVRRAGYAYVGPLGPKLDTREFSHDDLDAAQHEIEELLSNIADLSYARYTADTHCQWCSHNQLPCAHSVGEEFSEEHDTRGV
jgi:DNA helicase-2/ATP-dependent DNA helicase PcrA